MTQTITLILLFRFKENLALNRYLNVDSKKQEIDKNIININQLIMNIRITFEESKCIIFF